MPAIQSQSKTIVLIHGLFVTSKSWSDWKAFFEAQGYTCHTPANPFHDGEPAELRAHINPGLGKVKFKDTVDNLVQFIDTLPEKPILIGHSLGGLTVQKLIAMDKGVAGVCIDSAAPMGFISTQWSFWKANFPVINFFKGNSVFVPTKAWFHYAFCNNLSREASDANFDAFVVPESRNVPRSTLQPYAKINTRKAHQPLLFIAGEKDNIIPASLNRANYNAYKDPGSRKEFKEFSNRGHFICGEPNWEEVAEYIAGWLSKE
jgi:pimeloyl-ACP methyl ester carboxylesterase